MDTLPYFDCGNKLTLAATTAATTATNGAKSGRNARKDMMARIVCFLAITS